jgi:hypothetical protein
MINNPAYRFLQCFSAADSPDVAHDLERRAAGCNDRLDDGGTRTRFKAMDKNGCTFIGEDTCDSGPGPAPRTGHKGSASS